MKMLLASVVIAGFVLLGAGCRPAPSTTGQDGGAVPGGAAGQEISFSIPSLTSEGQINSSEYAGKVMLLDFWATWCPPCRSELPELNALSKEMEEKNVVIIGMTLDEGSREKVAANVAALGIAYPVGNALDYVKTSPAFREIRAIPTKYLVKDGAIVGGPYQGVVPIDQLKADIARLL
ncbi:MAG: TlpA family protein disulfide reductase [Spartobacteria bacterium]|nr:TlpA family protein disulfide reductase [Spartobacteria bacterium]